MSSCEDATGHHLVNEYDGGRFLASEGEELADELLALSQPLGDQVRGGHVEEGGLRLCGHRLCQV